jgi:CubicO group peptidase (beta-lactamase class C family)
MTLKMKVLKLQIYILTLVCFFNGLELVAQQGAEIDSTNLAKLIEFSNNTYTDEIMVICKNQVVCHWEREDCDSVYFNTASMIKSWTGLVIGILLDKGLISSEEDLVCKYIPQWKDGCEYKITIKNLLTMSAGLNRKSGAQGILAVEDMHQYALNVKLDTLPNIRFNYSNESVQLLGLVIEKVAGKSANDYFHEVLFEPLEMDSSRLGKDPKGNDVVFGGAITTVDDAAKIGLLMANEGKYDGKQIISEAWINKSLAPSKTASFYGYLWWLDNNSENKNFAATGDFGQMTIVFPDLDLIYLRKQSCNKELSGNMKWMGPDFLTLISSIVIKN